MIKDSLPRLVTLSGLGLTGTTSVARLLASRLSWDLILAGERFREYAKAQAVSLHAITLPIHKDFDALVQGDLMNRHSTVLDGRYLGFFAKDCPDVVRVSLWSNLPTRIARAQNRGDSKRDEAALVKRDQNERDTFRALYGDGDFLDPSLFHLNLTNNHKTSLDALAIQISEYCRGLRR